MLRFGFKSNMVCIFLFFPPCVLCRIQEMVVFRFLLMLLWQIRGWWRVNLSARRLQPKQLV